MVLDPGDEAVTKLTKSKVVSEEDYDELVQQHGSSV